jgi:uroporphyrin-III C-methyltransferase
MRAVNLLRRADAVVYDRLVDPAVIELAPPWAELMGVGKTPGGPSPSQDEINAILIDRGRRLPCVVRLKGGDPFVFGRGGEEAVALRAAGLEVEMVPGVTSAVAAPAAAGIPVTLRGVSSGFTVITAHQDPSSGRWLDWDALARAGTTLVILMGAARAEQIADRLRAGGMADDTPVAVISAATTRNQTIDRTNLCGLRRLPVASPATIVVGAVAARDVLADSELESPGTLTPLGAAP